MSILKKSAYMLGIAALVCVLAVSCGGKKGDKDRTNPPPSKQEAAIVDWEPVPNYDSHTPLAWFFERDVDGILNLVWFRSIPVDTRTWMTFNSTYPGPGVIVGGSYSNGHAFRAVDLEFRILISPKDTIRYHLTLERLGHNKFVGTETIVEDTVTTKTKVTYQITGT